MSLFFINIKWKLKFNNKSKYKLIRKQKAKSARYFAKWMEISFLIRDNSTNSKMQ